MDLKIRDIDVIAVRKIDQAAKEQKLSRNEYVKRHLEQLAHYDVFVEEKKRFEQMWEQNQQVIQACLKNIQLAVEQVKRLEAMVLLFVEIDEEEANSILSQLS